MRFAPALLSTLFLAACGPQEAWVSGSEAALGEDRAALGQPVRLVEAHALVGSTRNGQWVPWAAPSLGYGAAIAGRALGVVEVAAPRADSRVFIHFESHQSNQPAGAWDVVEATRVDGRRWEFATPTTHLDGSFHYIPRFVHTFAVEHRTSSGSAWDNNGGWNYVVSGDDSGGWVPEYKGPPAVLQGDLVVEQAWWEGSTLRGSVLVRNVGYGKRVKVVASTNGWKTSHTGEAAWVKQFTRTDFERWSFEVAAPAAVGEEVAFAAALELPGGGVQWDNNLGRDYHLRLDGVGSRWALGPVLSPGRLVFEGPAGQWAVRLERAPAADGAVVVSYDSERLPRCRGVKYGRPAWGITGFLRRGDTFETLPFVREDGALPQAGVLYTPVVFVPNPAELYFQVSDAYGCVSWDSNYGSNFVVRW